MLHQNKRIVAALTPEMYKDAAMKELAYEGIPAMMKPEMEVIESKTYYVVDDYYYFDDKEDAEEWVDEMEIHRPKKKNWLTRTLVEPNREIKKEVIDTYLPGAEQAYRLQMKAWEKYEKILNDRIQKIQTRVESIQAEMCHDEEYERAKSKTAWYMNRDADEPEFIEKFNEMRKAHNLYVKELEPPEGGQETHSD